MAFFHFNGKSFGILNILFYFFLFSVMNYASIKTTDVANWPGIRVNLFVSGCRHKCKGCFNALAWNFKFGKPYTQTEEDYIIQSLKPDFCEGLTLLWGEPLEPENQEMVSKLILRARATYPEKTIWLYSGFTWEQLQELKNNSPYLQDILDNIDVLVDGKFVLEKKDLTLKFRGSSNQRIIDVKKTNQSWKVELFDLE